MNLASATVVIVDRIASAAVRLERLSNVLLDYLRTEPRRLAERAADDVSPALIALSGGELPAWSLDPDRIYQVLTNILRNAVEASPAGSCIDLSVELRRNPRSNLSDSAACDRKSGNRAGTGQATMCDRHGNRPGAEWATVKLGAGWAFAATGSESMLDALGGRAPARMPHLPE